MFIFKIFRMKTNPFKFGTVVDGEFFTDRKEELEKISSFINGENHLILISPRRYGKTSLIKKIISESGRPTLYLDLQLVLSVQDFAAQLLKRIYRIYPIQKLKGYIKNFRIIPIVNLNPVTGQAEISFKPDSSTLAPLEDVLNLTEKLSQSKKKIVVVLDEFQEIFRIDSGLDRFLRSVMQNHNRINYVILGSSESMLREIFEKKNSPFYRFGTLMYLKKIPRNEFHTFLSGKFRKLNNHYDKISEDILDITGSHPFYTQQLAFEVWEDLILSSYKEGVVDATADKLIRIHDNDFERLWNTLKRTEMIILTGIASTIVSPLSEEFSQAFGAGATTTVYSALQKLVNKGLLVKEGTKYFIDDPFLKRWILFRRQV
jgi:uncharacterized protein